jgi:hypothetical protein
VRTRITVLAGAAAAVGALAARIFRKRQEEATPDPRAGDLRQRLDEARAVVAEREEFEAAETTVDEAEPAPDVDERRRELHEQARTAADDMRRHGESPEP